MEDAQITGVFISFEGCDGVGKSTQLNMVAERLLRLGIDVVQTREPGGSTGAEQIRELLVTGGKDRWSAETELLLFNAARKDHVEKTVMPALERGAVVLCDRYVDSTRAYQSVSEGSERDGVNRAMVDAIHDLLIDLNPKLTIFLDAEPERMLARAKARALENEEDDTRFESFGLGFQQALRNAFMEIADEEPIRCQIVNADQDLNQVHADIWTIMKRRVPELRLSDLDNE